MRFVFSIVLTILLLFPAIPTPTHGQKASMVRLLKDSQFFHVLSDHIADADHEIIVSMFLFKAEPDSSNRANMILERLVEAQKRGITVQVLLERTERKENFLNRENLATSRRLQRHGVKVVFDSPRTTTHTKVIVIDERFLFIGSHNLTHSALHHNHELSVLIDDTDLARETIRYLKRLET